MNIGDLRVNPGGGREASFWSGELPVEKWLGWASTHRAEVAIACGIIFRVGQFLSGRPYWLDEGAFIGNVRNLSPAEFFGPLMNSQLAPPGFLIAEWVAFRALGDDSMAFRLFPLLGGVASLFLLREVSRRCLPGPAVWLSVALLAVAGDPIYFSSEAKQYSTDMTAALGCTLLALTLGRRPLRARSAAILAGTGVVMVWYSHPSVFVLASAGFVGLATAIAARDARSSALWAAVGLAWVASFAGVHLVAMEQLDHRTMMWSFWEFAFPPIPPRSAWDATWVLRRLAFLFVNPLNFDFPFGPRLSMLPALLLAILGAGRLWAIDRSRFALLMFPLVFVLLASCFRLYPFHGRLVLFLTPAILIAIAAGLDLVRDRLGPGWVYRGCLAMVLVAPAIVACFHLAEPRRRDHGNPVGDFRPPSLDPFRFPL